MWVLIDVKAVKEDWVRKKGMCLHTKKELCCCGIGEVAGTTEEGKIHPFHICDDNGGVNMHSNRLILMKECVQK